MIRKNRARVKSTQLNLRYHDLLSMFTFWCINKIDKKKTSQPWGTSLKRGKMNDRGGLPSLLFFFWCRLSGWKRTTRDWIVEDDFFDIIRKCKLKFYRFEGRYMACFFLINSFLFLRFPLRLIAWQCFLKVE